MKLQKRAIRIITFSPYRCHTEPLFKNMSILRLDDIFKLCKLKFAFNYSHNLVPNYFIYEFRTVRSHDVHHYATRHNTIRLPRTTKICTEHCMRFYLGNIYRDFPRIITDKFVTHSYEGFKNYVKRFLLESYRELCNVQNCYICRLYGPWSSMYWFGESTHDNHLTNNILLINILNLFLETWVATFSCFFFVCDVLLILLFCKIINFDLF